MDFGIFVLAAVFMVIRIALSNEKKRKKENEQRAGRMHQAYGATDARAVHETTSLEKELYGSARSSPQAYGEGYSTWEGTQPNSPPQRKETPQQPLSQGQSSWGTTPTGSLPPRSEEERKRREAAALAAQRAEALRRERMERIARNKSNAQHGEYASSEGTSAYGQEGISVEGSSLNSELQRHKLEASALTGHAHTESSMSGKADNCDDYAIRNNALGQQSSPIPAMLRGLSFGNEDIVKGFIFGEILSKPKVLRR